jgi:hypothetical protein
VPAQTIGNIPAKVGADGLELVYVGGIGRNEIYDTNSNDLTTSCGVP